MRESREPPSGSDPMTSPPLEESPAAEPEHMPEPVPRALRLRWFLPVLGTLLLPAALLAQGLAAGHPGWIEEHYSQALFPRISSALASISRHSPVSLAELLILVLVFLIGVGVLRTLRQLSLSRSRGPGWLLIVFNGSLRLLALAGFLYTAYLASWGFNHHRQSFATVAGWEVERPTAGLMVELACQVTEDLNALRDKLEEDDQQVMRLGLDRRELERAAREAYGGLGTLHPSLKVAPGVPRRPIASPLMSASWITGIYSPFTAEAHINDEIPDAQLAFVTSHELAHSLGFAREDEANFLAYLACRESAEPALAYSGALAAWRYLSGALARIEPRRLLGVTERLSAPVVRDLTAINKFWTRERSSFTDFATEVNHNYLKSQGQAEGVATYGLVVDLLVEDWRRSRPDFQDGPLASALEEVSDREVRIAFIGGCFTFSGEEGSYAYPERVAELLLQEGVDTRIYNLGSCDQGLLQSLSAMNLAVELKVDLAVLELGAADLEAGIRPDLLRERLDQVFFTARRAGVRVLLVTGERTDVVTNPERATLLDELIRLLAETRGARVVTGFTDGLAGIRAALDYDLEHPNYESIQVLADRVLPQLLPMVWSARRAWALELVAERAERAR